MMTPTCQILLGAAKEQVLGLEYANSTFERHLVLMFFRLDNRRCLDGAILEEIETFAALWMY